MISTKLAINILTEQSPEEQAKLIDELAEDDAKHLLRIAMGLLRGEDVAA